MKLRSYCAWSAELVPLEKITQWHGENNEIEDTWYEEIEEHQQFLNPYYAVPGYNILIYGGFNG
jgi:hypothetical protein